MNRRRILLFALIIFLSFSSLERVLMFQSNNESANLPPEIPELNYHNLSDAVDITEVKRHMEFFSSLGTRATGYLGNLLAAQYIREKFVEYGLKNVTVHYFNVTDCIDYGANITLMNENLTLRLYPLLPNLVCPSTTPPEGITGKIIYAGEGYIEDFKFGALAANTSMEGNIVLLDWNTRNRWINAARLGAEAVIFLPPPPNIPESYMISGYGSFRYGWFEKYLPNIPFNFPRFYANGTDAEILLKHQGEEVRIVSTQRWRNLVGQNIIGFVEGKNKDFTVLISSYYDSCAITPSLAPGAQEATGISYLLELARYLAKPENKPENSIIFVAFGGHGQSLTGSHSFIRDYRSFQRKPELKSIGEKIWLHINLDLSTGTDIIQEMVAEAAISTPYGGPFGGDMPGITEFLENSTYRLWNKIVSARPELAGKFYSGSLFPRSIDITQEYYSISHQPWTQAQLFSMDHTWTIRTNVIAWSYITAFAFDTRPYFGTPFDTIDKVNFKNLATICKVLNCLITGFVNVKDIISLYTAKLSQDAVKTLHSELKRGPWSPLKGKVVYWSPEKADWFPVPHAIVFWMATGKNPEGNVYLGAGAKRFHYMPFTIADENGSFEVFSWHEWLYSWVSAWVINETTGNVLMAPDYGVNKHSGDSVYQYETDTLEDIGLISIFNCSSIVLFDVMIPGLMELYSPEFPAGGLVISQYQVPEYAPTVYYGERIWFEYPYVVVEFVEPNKPLGFMWKFSNDRNPQALIVNSTSSNPLGEGYTLKHGEQLIIPMTALQYAENMYYLNEERIKILLPIEPQIKESDLYKNHLKVQSLLKNVTEAIANYDYPRAKALSFKAWFLNIKVYNDLRQKIEDSSYFIPIISAILIPFVVLAEKLLFNWRGYKKLISLLGLFILYVLAFYFLHPGFHLAGSPMMVIIGFMILVLCIPINIFLLKYFQDYFNELSIARLGKHAVAIRRISNVIDSFSIGVENMRKRKLRSTLTIISIILMTSAIVNLSALSTIVLPVAMPVSNANPNYQGIYIHRKEWGKGFYSISDGALTLIKFIAEDGTNARAIVAPRAWRYETAYREDVPPKLQRLHLGFKMSYNGKTVYARCLWGLTAEEDVLGEISPFLVAGRWFQPDEKRVVILTENQAKTLGIDETSLLKYPTVVIEGMPHRVIGILSNEVQNIPTLDGQLFTPLKFDILIPPNPWFLHLESGDFIILPYKEVIDLGGDTASISIKVEDADRMKEVADELRDLFPHMTIYSCIDKEVRENTSGFFMTIWGWEQQVVVMVLNALAILNVLLGSIYERKRDIYTYSVTGVSPINISFMFLAEILVSALLGVVFGFILALLMGRFIIFLMPITSFLNYSSRWVLMVMGMVVTAVSFSSIYPIFVASRIVTPSLERRWKISTKPVRDLWQIPLPFFASDEKEAEGIIGFIKEFMEAHGNPDASDFYITSLSLIEGKTDKGSPLKSLVAETRLFPYDAGVTQTFTLLLYETEKSRWQISITLKRTGGNRRLWKDLNKNFLDVMRRQFLLWRTLSREERKKYRARSYGNG